MKKFVLIPILFLLAACGPTSQVVTSDKLVVVMPDETFFNCPTLKTFPNPEKLTDVQVARLIIELYKDNQICKNSIEGIKKFLEEAQKKLEEAK